MKNEQSTPEEILLNLILREIKKHENNQIEFRHMITAFLSNAVDLLDNGE